MERMLIHGRISNCLQVSGFYLVQPSILTAFLLLFINFLEVINKVNTSQTSAQATDLFCLFFLNVICFGKFVKQVCSVFQIRNSNWFVNECICQHLEFLKFSNFFKCFWHSMQLTNRLHIIKNILQSKREHPKQNPSIWMYPVA